MNYQNWYDSIPTYNNQLPKNLDNFDQNTQFIDNDFPPSKQSLVTQKKIDELNYLYSKEKDSKKKKEIKEDLDFALFLYNEDEIKWERISELYPNYELFPKNLNSDSFSQNYIGDCYFLSMVSLISNYSQLVKRLFPIKKNNYGYYEVILFLNGWKRVIIDDYIPVTKDKSEPIGAQSQKYKNCFYHMLIEKAWAKINKVYFNIEGGSPDNALFVLTGFKGQITNLYEKKKL